MCNTNGVVLLHGFMGYGATFDGKSGVASYPFSTTLLVIAPEFELRLFIDVSRVKTNPDYDFVMRSVLEGRESDYFNIRQISAGLDRY